MEKFSVKQPSTVLVAVVMVLILGFVAITKMQTNLLPDVSIRLAWSMIVCSSSSSLQAVKFTANMTINNLQ